MTGYPIGRALLCTGVLLAFMGCNGADHGGQTGGDITSRSGTGGARVSGTGAVTGSIDDPGTGAGGAAASTTPSSSDLPCAVAAIVQANCSTCHGASPRFGSPMSLVTSANFRAASTIAGMTVGQAVVARIHDDAHPMPQAPAARLTDADASSLESWIKAGAQSSSCASPVTPVGGNTGTGGAAASTVTDPDVTCYELRAHDPGSKTTPYNVPATPDLYHCFSFAPPWGSDKVHMVGWKPIINNDKVIHHWILYNDAGAVTDGSAVDCSGAHPTAQMVTGWAPGGEPLPYPPDVGQAVAGLGFTLETHYNNTSSTPQPDSSGISICVTKKLRKNEAGIHWLGTEGILLPAGGKASGTCTPKATTPVTIISATPHMHLLGRHLTTVINRKGGKTEMLIDKPFDFANQITYETPSVIMPGDTLTTTCEYGGAAFYGMGTKQEMCYNFVLAYPNGGLSSGSLLRENGCTGL
jgi:mono/diheme cytochrome c family protein